MKGLTPAETLALIGVLNELSDDSDWQASLGESTRDWYQGRANAFRSAVRIIEARTQPPAAKVAAVRQENPTDPSDLLTVG